MAIEEATVQKGMEGLQVSKMKELKGVGGWLLRDVALSLGL